MQYMVVDQLGTILTGAAPLEYVKDIRTAIMYILNVLVTRQRPAILLKRPEYRKAKRRVMELGEQMIRDATARYASTRPEDRNLVDDIMAAHIETPEKMPASDLIVSLDRPLRCRARHRREHHFRRPLLRAQASGRQGAHPGRSGCTVRSRRPG
jgi:hypothetical protein